MSGAPGMKSRNFLFLQGPHGPFFMRLAKMLAAAGASTWRVGFNRGDQAFWHDADSYIPFTDKTEAWPATFAALVEAHQITDLVLYGDMRAIHAKAIAHARRRGITVHVFEEGYLRPYWVTYERGGTNGNSPLVGTDVATMQNALDNAETDLAEAPAHWGDMRQHIFYGALYHAFVMLANRKYRHFKSHRSISVRDEFKLYLKRLLLMPFHWAARVAATSRIKRGGFPYHLVLLQLEHDSSFRSHSPFETSAEFLSLVFDGFVKGAPQHHHLVFKAHPLEDGRTDQRGTIARLAREHGITHRVHYVRGGKLARLLDHTRSAVTVNSTAAQQVLWRGLPLKVFGQAVYDKEAFVSTQNLRDFFAGPTRPNTRAYRDYRRYLLETSQIAGGFYATTGRQQLLRQVVDMMLAAEDPYDALLSGTATPRQQLRVIK